MQLVNIYIEQAEIIIIVDGVHPFFDLSGASIVLCLHELCFGMFPNDLVNTFWSNLKHRHL